MDAQRGSPWLIWLVLLSTAYRTAVTFSQPQRVHVSPELYLRLRLRPLLFIALRLRVLP
jgi:hypothetical protein